VAYPGIYDGGLALILDIWYLVSIILNVVIFVTNRNVDSIGTSGKVTKMKFKIINNYSLLRVQTDVTVLR